MKQCGLTTTTTNISMCEQTEHILGDSKWAVAMRSRVAQVARYRYNVMITGPGGSGKRFVAARIHMASPRRTAPFVPLDCSLLTEETFSAQLFGHVAGGFAANAAPAMGVLRAAHGGTLMLGRIDALTPELQKSLHQVLQRKQVTPVGGRESFEVEFRIISSTRIDLQRRVQERKAIPELYRLLDELSLSVEPLAQRREDIVPLVDHFLRSCCQEFALPRKRFLPESIKILQSYHWPGNVTELIEVVERSALAEDSEIILPEHLEF